MTDGLPATGLPTTRDVRGAGLVATVRHVDLVRTVLPLAGAGRRAGSDPPQP